VPLQQPCSPSRDVIVVAVLVLLVSIPVLSKSADIFVTSASRASLRYHMSPVLVGALIIGFGTSLPEALASVLAAASGEIDVAVGNVVGSNVANLTLVLGPAALLCAIVFPPPVLRREVVLMLASSIIFVALLSDNALGRGDGLILLAGLGVVVGAMVRTSGGDDELEREVAEFADGDFTSGQLWMRLVLGLTGTVLGAYLLVRSASTIADHLGLAGGLVGVSIVAIGTSLPEMVTSYHAARRGEGELIVGNLLGSNIFNTFLVGGMAALVGPGAVGARLAGGATWTMVAVSATVALLALSFRRIPKAAAPFLIAGYAAVLIAVA
jgi:cation:H+ antiporter